MNLVEIKDLSFSYPTKKDTLKNINLKIKKGSFYTIIGENGSGKSTLLKCIVGLNKDYTGEIIKTTQIRLSSTEKSNTKQFPSIN